jgi:hypothetical protein
MAQVAARLIFWKPVPGSDTVQTGKALLAGDVATKTGEIDAPSLLAQLKATRGFTRLHLRDRAFSLDNPRAQSALEGEIHDRHLDVRFYGNLEPLAKPFFEFMSRQGLLCYAQGDPDLLREWPKFREPEIDKDYAARMQRVLQRHNEKLREQEPDPKKRAKAMTAYMRSDEFQAEMGRERPGN